MDDLLGTDGEAKVRALLESSDDQPDSGEALDEGKDYEQKESEAEEEAPDDAEDKGETETEVEESETGIKDDDQPQYEVKVDGETMKVPLKELIAGYQRQADYTRKTQELAQQRQAFEQENATLKRLAEVIERDPQTLEFIKRRLFEMRFGKPYTPQAEEQVRNEREINQYRSEALISRFATAHPEVNDEQLLQVVQYAGKVAAGDPDKILDAMEIAYKALEAQSVNDKLRELEEENKRLKAQKRDEYRESRTTIAPRVQGKGGSTPRNRGKAVTLDGEGGTISAKEAALKMLNSMQGD